MNIKNIKFQLNSDEENKLHFLEIFDANRRESIVKGELISIEQPAEVTWENLLFRVYSGQVWISFDTLNAFIQGPKIVEEIIEQQNLPQ